MMRLSFLLIGLLTATGCSVQPSVMEGNYMTYDYAVSERAEAAIQANAQALCLQRKKLAIRTEYACLLPRCSATYQCVEADEARESGLGSAPGR